MIWAFFALAASLISGIHNVLKKSVLLKENTFEFLTILYLLSFLLILPFARQVNIVSPNIFAWILLRALVIFVAAISFHKAFKHMDISVVMPLTNIRLLFVLLFGFLFLGETASGIQLIGIFGIVFGSYLLEVDGKVKNYKRPIEEFMKSKYMHYLLLFSVFSAFSSIITKHVLTDIKPLDLLFYHFSITVVVYVFLTFVLYGGFKDISEGWNIAGPWIFLIAILGIAALFLLFSAYADPNGKVVLIVPLLQVSVLFNILVGGKMYHEKHIFIRLLSGLIIIGGVVFLFV